MRLFEFGVWNAELQTEKFTTRAPRTDEVMQP
jgi:hypothetical protein